jgi:hypothetical protein
MPGHHSRKLQLETGKSDPFKDGSTENCQERTHRHFPGQVTRRCFVSSGHFGSFRRYHWGSETGVERLFYGIARSKTRISSPLYFFRGVYPQGAGCRGLAFYGIESFERSPSRDIIPQDFALLIVYWFGLTSLRMKSGVSFLVLVFGICLPWSLSFDDYQGGLS